MRATAMRESKLSTSSTHTSRGSHDRPKPRYSHHPLPPMRRHTVHRSPGRRGGKSGSGCNLRRMWKATQRCRARCHHREDRRGVLEFGRGRSPGRAEEAPIAGQLAHREPMYRVAGGPGLGRTSSDPQSAKRENAMTRSAKSRAMDASAARMAATILSALIRTRSRRARGRLCQRVDGFCSARAGLNTRTFFTPPPSPRPSKATRRGA